MCEYDEFSLLIYAGRNTGITVLLLLIFLEHSGQFLRHEF
jgi:hypothetical protein